MAEIRCQMCGKLSSDELEICPFCQARLTPLHMASPTDDAEGSDSGSSIDDNLLERIEGDQDTDSLENDTQQGAEMDTASNPDEVAVRDWLAGLDQDNTDEIDTPDLDAEGLIDTVENDPDNDLLDRLNSQYTSTSDTPQDNEKQDDYAERDLAEWVQDFKEDAESERQTFNDAGSDLPLDDQESSENWLDRLEPDREPGTQEIADGLNVRDDMDLGDTDALPDSILDSFEETSLEDDIETPDWLKNIQAETLDLSGDTASDEAQSPDWMADLQAGSDQSDNAMNTDERDMPAWLREIGADSLEFGEAMSSDSSSADFEDEISLREGIESPSELSQGVKDLDQDFDTFDSDSRLKDATLLEGESLMGEPPSNQIEMTETPSLSGSLEDLGFSESVSISPESPDLGDGTIDDISGELETVDLPEWLKELKNPEVVESDELMDAETAKKLDALPDGELPEWIQDMQPVESMLPKDGIVEEKLNEFVENTGPLAGLTGVLPPPDDVEDTRHSTKPYQDSPVLSGEQNQQVEIFKQILNSESDPKKPPLLVKKSSHRLLRWIVAIIMIAAVFIPVLVNLPTAIPTSNYPPEMIQARQIIFELPDDSPVLMIFDYGPAYSAELEAATSSIVGDLINKNSRLVFLSTSPTGMVLADHLMNIVSSQGTSQIDPRVIKLGYLAAATQGMASFASNPSSAIPVSTDGAQVWGENLVLQDVENFSDFAAVILFTENAETVRNWVEQAEGYLGNTPLLVGASAQAEPMVRPYFESGQVDGMVTGLAGGKAYEQAVGTSGLSAGYWNAFTSGLFVIELIIIIGGLWSFFGSLRDRKLTRKEEV